jgi:DNA-binding NtrC family response regulator
VRRLDDFTQALAEARPLVALVNTAARGLDWRSAITAARVAQVPLVAFGSHVDIATQQEARALGATNVVANSKLASDLPGIVARALLRRSSAGSNAEPEADDTAS